MPRPNSYKHLCALLVMLLLSNSSLALELFTHDAHQHGVESGQHGVEFGQVPHDVMHSASSTNSTDATIEPGSEDCLCDDVCCASSIGFGVIGNQDKLLTIESSSQKLTDLYQSIALDLLLPPPTY